MVGGGIEAFVAKRLLGLAQVACSELGTHEAAKVVRFDLAEANGLGVALDDAPDAGATHCAVGEPPAAPGKTREDGAGQITAPGQPCFDACLSFAAEGRFAWLLIVFALHENDKAVAFGHNLGEGETSCFGDAQPAAGESRKQRSIAQANQGRAVGLIAEAAHIGGADTYAGVRFAAVLERLGAHANNLVEGARTCATNIALASRLTHKPLHGCEAAVDGLGRQRSAGGEVGAPARQGGRIKRSLTGRGEAQVGSDIAAIAGERRGGELACEDFDREVERGGRLRGEGLAHGVKNSERK